MRVSRTKRTRKTRAQLAHSRRIAPLAATKPASDACDTCLVYYGRRYYSPSQGRFLGRDPAEEKGGLHLYGFVLNDPLNDFDVLGGTPWTLLKYDEGGSGQPVVKLPAFIVAGRKQTNAEKEQIRNGLNGSGILAPPNGPFTISLPWLPPKTEEQKKEEERQRKCAEIAELTAQAVDIRQRNQRSFESGGQYYELSNQLKSQLQDGGALIVAAGGAGVSFYSLGVDGQLKLNGTVGEYGTQFFTNVTPQYAAAIGKIGIGLSVVGSAFDLSQLNEAANSGDAVGIQWGIYNTTAGALGLAAGALIPPVGVAIGIVQFGQNAMKFMDDQKNLTETLESAQASDNVIRAANEKLADLEKQRVENRCP